MAEPNQRETQDPMLTRLHQNGRLQKLLGLLIGIAFGFLLQKGGVTRYDVILEQLLLRDFTVVKIMLSAVAVGMIGVHLLIRFGWARHHLKPGAVGTSIVGGLIFGAGFAVLGYCPGTIAGAVGQGSLDALAGGVVGILLGSGLFAILYPRLQRPILERGSFGETTFPQLLRASPGTVVPVAVVLIGVVLLFLERCGR